MPRLLALLRAGLWLAVLGGAAEASAQAARPVASRVLPRGSCSECVGFRPAAPDFPADGAAAVAVGPRGDVWVLDRVNARVLQLGADGLRASVASEVPADAQDLAVAPDGAWTAFSPLRARAWVHQAGVLVGEVPVPRELREIVTLDLAAGRQVLARTSYQETVPLGTPALPRLTADALRSAREGAAFLADGAGVAVRVANGRAELLLVAPGEHARVRARHVLPEKVLGARVVGAAGTTACLLLEQELAASPLSLTRRAVCLDASGRRQLDVALPGRGLHAPRRELAVGAARLAFIGSRDDGLLVQVWALPAGGAR